LRVATAVEVGPKETKQLTPKFPGEKESRAVHGLYKYWWIFYNGNNILELQFTRFSGLDLLSRLHYTPIAVHFLTGRAMSVNPI